MCAAQRRMMPPNLIVIPAAIPSFPPQHRHSHPNTVIPAKAGIHTPAYRYPEENRGSGFRPAPE